MQHDHSTALDVALTRLRYGRVASGNPPALETERLRLVLLCLADSCHSVTLHHLPLASHQVAGGATALVLKWISKTVKVLCARLCSRAIDTRGCGQWQVAYRRLGHARDLRVWYVRGQVAYRWLGHAGGRGRGAEGRWPIGGLVT